MPFLLPNQQRQSTEGKKNKNMTIKTKLDIQFYCLMLTLGCIDVLGWAAAVGSGISTFF